MRTSAIYIDDVLDWTLQLGVHTGDPADDGDEPADAGFRVDKSARPRRHGPDGRAHAVGRTHATQRRHAQWPGLPCGAATDLVDRGQQRNLSGRDIGPIGPLAKQDRIGGFWLPQRGIFFADGMGRFESFDPARHVGAVGAR